jgi:TonB family protein
MFRRLRFRDFVLISFAIHGLLALSSLVPKIQPPPPEVVVEIITPSEPLPKQAVRPVRDKQQKNERLERQIVEQEQKKSDQEAPDTRFLSAQNQKVEKQTVARTKGEFRNENKESQKSTDSSNPKNWNLAPKIASLEKVEEEGLKKAEKASDPEKSADRKGNEVEGSQTQDYIKDVDQGLETLLNAREFKYYTYYNRIRKQLSQHWEPKVRHKLSEMFKKGRYLASSTDRITKLVVVLDKGGNLVKVQVIKESGVTDLDDAATEAFQSAAPFPNPPAGIVENDGTVKIRWDFVLEG